MSKKVATLLLVAVAALLVRMLGVVGAIPIIVPMI